MATQEVSTSRRERWYEERLQGAETPRQEFDILTGRLAADVKRLPEELHHGIYEAAADALRGILGDVNEAMVSFGPAKGMARS